MVMNTQLVFVLALLGWATALVEFKAIDAPAHWIKVDQPPHPMTRMRLFVALKQRNLDVLEAKVLKAADPDDTENYGQWLSHQEVDDLLAPAPENIKLVMNWLHSHGIKDAVLTKSKDFVKITTTLQSVERMLSTKLSRFQHATHDKVQILRSDLSYFLPEEIDQAIDFIAPIHGFSRVATRASAHDRYSDVQAVPSLIRSYYNVTISSKPAKFVNNTQAVEEFSYDFFSPQDVQQFFSQFSPNLKGQKVLKVMGINNNSFITTEADLDVEYIMAIGAYAPTYMYSYNYDTPDIMILFLEWVVDLSDDPSPPLVHSVSYGEYGGDYPIRQVLRISNQWMKLTGQGLTIMFASGDDGAGCNSNGTYFAFPYPSSPWITLVGSTGFYQSGDDANKYYEQGASFSSGGFSNDFEMPVWQEAAVKHYLQTAPNISSILSYFNPKGRALPDISTVGENVQIIQDGSQTPVAGTSCSSPIFAGMVSLLNGVRLSSGKKPMGFINPFLYKLQTKYANAYYDVTVGYNAQYGCPGFEAWKGWDPVTGLGTPNFEVLLKAVKALP